MRFVLADDDAFMLDLVQAVVTSTGHQVAGVADTAMAAAGLIGAAHPDVVILDLSVTINTDFDIIATAIEAGAEVIVFSHHTDTGFLEHYAVPIAVVAKPDVSALEGVLREVGRPVAQTVSVGSGSDRRRRPARQPAGPTPMGITDAQAFFEAINGAWPGDVIVAVHVPRGATTMATDVARLMRGTDRLLAFPDAVRFYLPSGGEESVRSLLARASAAGAVPPGCWAASVVVGEGEHGADAFNRLKHGGDEQLLPSP